MEKTEDVRLYDKVMALVKEQGRENEVVKAVITDPQKANGVCVRCKDEGEVLRFTVFVYTQGNLPAAICEERFTVDYCEYCMLSVLRHNEDAKDALGTMYR